MPGTTRTHANNKMSGPAAPTGYSGIALSSWKEMRASTRLNPEGKLTISNSNSMKSRPKMRSATERNLLHNSSCIRRDYRTKLDAPIAVAKSPHRLPESRRQQRRQSFHHAVCPLVCPPLRPGRPHFGRFSPNEHELWKDREVLCNYRENLEARVGIEPTQPIALP